MVLTGFALVASGADRIFDFGQYPVNQSPGGFTSAVTGEGKPGDWKIIRDEVATGTAANLESPVAPIRKTVLAQLAKDKTDEHFPILIFDGDVYGDFTFTTRFKAVDGEAEQMAGIAFRIQDAKNYYVVRASAKGSTFKFYKVVDGQRGQPVGPSIEIPKGAWHELGVEAHGNKFRLLLNGNEVTSVTDDKEIFIRGKIGFWTKSDSVSYFADANIHYTPIEPLIVVAVRDVMKRYPRILGLTVYGSLKQDNNIAIVAANDEKTIGQAATEVEKNVIDKGSVYTDKKHDSITVTLPIRDRNGDIVAAARIKLSTFIGQTESNGIARAMPIAKTIEEYLHASKDLVE